MRDWKLKLISFISGGAFYPQVKELGYSLEIQDGYTLSMYTARFSGEHDSHGSWDLGKSSCI